MSRGLKTTIVVCSIVAGLAVALTLMTGTATAAFYVFQIAGLFAIGTALIWPDIRGRFSSSTSPHSSRIGGRGQVPHRK
jgi:hypothetical protein